jgi:hypothetical protein
MIKKAFAIRIKLLSVCLACSVLFVGKASANNFEHEITALLQGGLSTLRFDNSSAGVGATFGLGYRYAVNANMAVSTGLELGLYNARYNQKSPFIQPGLAMNVQGENVVFNSTITAYTERVNTSFLQIPIMFTYGDDLHGWDADWFASIGFKFAIPMNAKFENTTSYDASFWSATGATYDHDYWGLGTYNNKKRNSSIDNLKTAVIFALEGGMKWSLTDNLSLYTGIYFDFGLNDIKGNTDAKPWMEHQVKTPKSEVVTNSYLATEAVKKIAPMAIGINLRLAFGLGNNLTAYGAGTRVRD